MRNLAQFPGVKVVDSPAQGVPMPATATGTDDVFVGRIRTDLSVEHGLNLWVVGDQNQKRGGFERRTDR